MLPPPARGRILLPALMMYCKGIRDFEKFATSIY